VQQVRERRCVLSSGGSAEAQAQALSAESHSALPLGARILLCFRRETKSIEKCYTSHSVFFPFSAHEFCVCPINNRRLLALSFLLSLTCRACSGSTVSICESPFRHRLRPPAALLVGDADSFPVATSPLRPSLCLSVVLPSPPPWRRPPRSPLTPAPPAPPRHLIPLRHCHHLPPRPLPQRLATGLPPRGRGTRDLRGPRVHQRRQPHPRPRAVRVREGELPPGCCHRAGEELGRRSPRFVLSLGALLDCGLRGRISGSQQWISGTVS